MELSFVDIDDVIEVNERLLKHLFKEVINVDVEIPFKRMPWQEAMDRFGSDKPDTRFGMELCDVSDVVKDCGFGVFTGALENGGSVEQRDLLICASMRMAHTSHHLPSL